MRYPAFALSFAFLALAPSARAATDCPDGWFCDDSGPPSPPAAARPAPGSPPGPPPAGEPDLAEPSYPPPGEPGMLLDRPENNPPPPRRRPHHFHQWGFNLHLEGATFGHQSGVSKHTGMGGAGFSFRYRPLPALALDAGVDLLAGTDYNGYSRGEAGLLLNALGFFNPRDPVRLYVLGGFGFSGASVRVAPGSTPNSARYDQHYSYVGVQGGLGLEVRLSREIALNGEFLGLIRGRTDDHQNRSPEFEDPVTHRVSNTSGAGLLRVGATFSW